MHLAELIHLNVKFFVYLARFGGIHAKAHLACRHHRVLMQLQLFSPKRLAIYPSPRYFCTFMPFDVWLGKQSASHNDSNRNVQDISIGHGCSCKVGICNTFHDLGDECFKSIDQIPPSFHQLFVVNPILLGACAVLFDEPFETILEFHFWVYDVDVEERSLVLRLH